MTEREQFQRAEDEYFRLKGQLTTGHITLEQFEAAIKNLMVQDAQGRYWALGPDTSKWHVHDGTTWVEAQPTSPSSSSDMSGGAGERLAPPRKSNTALWIAGCGCALMILLGVIAVFFALSQDVIKTSLTATATPTFTPLSPIVVAPQSVVVPRTDQTTVAQEIFATATENARAIAALDISIATRVSASLTAVAPASVPIASNPTRPVPTSTLTPVPTIAKGPQKKLEPIRTTSVTGISVVDLATGATQQIYGEPNIASAAWSPNGAKVLLSSDLPGRRALRTIDLANNLTSDLYIEGGKQYNTGSQEALWSPDGTRIFLHNVTIPHSTASLVLFDSSGKLLNIVDRRLDKEGVPLFWSVDGKWVITIAAMPDSSPTLRYTLYAEEVATLSDLGRKSIPEWQQYQQSVGASDQVFDERYWPWVERSAPSTCSAVDYFSACP
jgi:hypothetical protein